LRILKFFLNSKELSKNDIKYDNVNNILIVRQHNQLGDMLCSVPLFAALRKKFSAASITLVASPINYKVLYSEINPYIDDVIIFNKSTLLHLFRFFKKLRSKKYDIGIVPSTVSVSRTSHFINYLSGAIIRVGVRSINGKKNKTEFLLNIKSDFEWAINHIHQTERNLDIGRQIGCDLTEEEKKQVGILLSEDEKKFAEDYIRENFPDKSKKILVFHAGAGKVQNRWSSKNFVELINKFYENYDCYIIITSGKIDREITDFIVKELKKSNINCTILEKESIRQIAAILLKTDLYITNDTGTMHVAVYVNAKVIGLFGPTYFYEWGPINENGTYIQSPTENIDDITVDEVYEKAKLYLK
jgi:ADP-heptose:LPS heptosyltransferase